MRPGCEIAYPFSLPSHHSCCRALDTVSIVMISFNIVYFACQVIVIGIYLLFLISYKKKHFSFGLVVAMSLTPPHTRYSYKELHAPGQNWGGHYMVGLIFPP
jgi:hypothetical protein